MLESAGLLVHPHTRTGRGEACSAAAGRPADGAGQRELFWPWPAAPVLGAADAVGRCSGARNWWAAVAQETPRATPARRTAGQGECPVSPHLRLRRVYAGSRAQSRARVPASPRPQGGSRARGSVAPPHPRMPSAFAPPASRQCRYYTCTTHSAKGASGNTTKHLV